MPYAKITTETLKHGGAFDSRSLLQKKPKNDLEWIGELFADSKPLRTHSTNCLTHLAGLIGIARQMSDAPPCLRGESSLSRAVTVPIPAPPAPAPPPPPHAQDYHDHQPGGFARDAAHGFAADRLVHHRHRDTQRQQQPRPAGVCPDRKRIVEGPVMVDIRGQHRREGVNHFSPV